MMECNGGRNPEANRRPVGEKCPEEFFVAWVGETGCKLDGNFAAMPFASYQDAAKPSCFSRVIGKATIQPVAVPLP
jgi:hypothetical protein